MSGYRVESPVEPGKPIQILGQDSVFLALNQVTLTEGLEFGDSPQWDVDTSARVANRATSDGVFPVVVAPIEGPCDMTLSSKQPGLPEVDNKTVNTINFSNNLGDTVTHVGATLSYVYVTLNGGSDGPEVRRYDINANVYETVTLPTEGTVQSCTPMTDDVGLLVMNVAGNTVTYRFTRTAANTYETVLAGLDGTTATPLFTFMAEEKANGDLAAVEEIVFAQGGGLSNIKCALNPTSGTMTWVDVTGTEATTDVLANFDSAFSTRIVFMPNAVGSSITVFKRPDPITVTTTTFTNPVENASECVYLNGGTDGVVQIRSGTIYYAQWNDILDDFFDTSWIQGPTSSTIGLPSSAIYAGFARYWGVFGGKIQLYSWVDNEYKQVGVTVQSGADTTLTYASPVGCGWTGNQVIVLRPLKQVEQRLKFTAAESSNGIPWWVWLIVALVIALAFGLGLGFGLKKKKKK